MVFVKVVSPFFLLVLAVFGVSTSSESAESKKGCPELVGQIAASDVPKLEQRIAGCLTPGCLAAREKLIQLGYAPEIAQRIAVYRPDLYEMIVSPHIKITPEKLIVRPDIVSSFPSTEWFASQVQDRDVVTVYRGLEGSGDSYDPTYHSAQPYLPEAGSLVDCRVFTTDDVSKAARNPKTDNIVLRMQIPRFLLYTSAGGPWGLVYFRDMVPNDLVFVSHVAFVKPGTPREVELKFISLEEALPKLSQTFLPTKSQ